MSSSSSNNNNTTQQLSLADMQAAEVTQLAPAILYTSLMMLMGACGNSVVCYVYGFRWQSTVTKIFIFSLAALDLCNSLVCMPTEIAMLVRIVTFDSPSWCKISRFLTYTLNGSSSLILVSIALDRWYKVCRPLSYFFTDRRAKMTCVGAVVLAASLSWPSLVLYGNLTVPVHGSDVNGVTCLVSDDYIDTWLPLVFYSLYFSCYVVLVVVITVLYSLIAVRLVRLKRQQKERMRAKYAGIRSSRLIYASQESIPLTLTDRDGGGGCGGGGGGGRGGEENGDAAQPHCGVRIHMIAEEAEVFSEGFQSAVANVEVVPALQTLRQEDGEESRRSVTFVLPGHPANADGEKVAADSSGPGGQNGSFRHELTQKTPSCQKETADKEQRFLAPGESSEERGLRVTENGPRQQLERSGEDVGDHSQPGPQQQRRDDDGANEPDVQVPHAGPEGNPNLSKDVRQLPLSDPPSHPESHEEETDEFEGGIHFASYTDITWQHNPIADSVIVNSGDQLGKEGSAVVVTLSAAHVKDLTDDDAVQDSDVDVNRSFLTESAKSRVQKTKSESFALPQKGGLTGRNRLTVHKTSSDSKLLTPETASARNSFLMPPGGYPGGHTPTSRLPTPVGTPSPDGADNRPVRLSGALILERLSKKMAYRPAKTTRMLFAISIVFVVSFFPFFCVVILRAVHGRQFLASLSNSQIVLVSIFIRSSMISNAANPIIYGLCNKQFRTECRRLIGRCHGNRQDVVLRVMEQTDDNLGSANST